MRVLLLLGLVPLSYALRSASRTSAAGGRQRGALRASRASAVDAGPQGGAADRAIHETDSFVARKAALVEGLRREYTSFFQPMEENLYAPGVTFSDPLISLEGVSAYKNNVNMLAGDSMLGKILFTDCGLVMHNVTTDSPESRTLCTRWTLQFRFKLLPWQPLAQFTGISQYTLDDEARVLRQEDFWDSINLEAGGTYKPAGKAAGLLDMLKQFGPRIERRTAARQELRHDLLRRAARYEVRRYPEYLAVGTECEPWEGGILKVFADASFAASVAKELTPQDPLIILAASDAGKPRRVRVPLRELPSASEMLVSTSLNGTDVSSRLERLPQQVVAMMPLSEKPTPEAILKSSSMLKALVEADGLKAADIPADLAIFGNAGDSERARFEIWLILEMHPWNES